jgi:hypothetical protein
MNQSVNKSQIDKISAAGLIVTLGIIYGDIGIVLFFQKSANLEAA